MYKMTIGIVGHGFVGKAVDAGFQSTGLTKVIIDPRLGTKIRDDLIRAMPEIVFVAVPTPMGENGSIDSSIIEDVVYELSSIPFSPIIVIKSTVTPPILDKLLQFTNNIVYNPEFLTERNAIDDFINAELHVFGGAENLTNRVYDAYRSFSVCKNLQRENVVFTDLKTASMIKYTVNSFLALKVLFFNQVHALYNAVNAQDSWENFIGALAKDTRIGSSHMAVPGPDGRYGYGGACFPKDTAAMTKLATSVGTDFSVLQAAVLANQEIRSMYTNLDAREKEQNVSFNIFKRPE
jgi:UDPglucose 6-dehydrogenase